MATLLITHLSCLQHDTGEFHPERPDRLRAVLKALSDGSFSALQRADAPQATLEQLTRVHPRQLVETILGVQPPEGELVNVDADTVISAGTGEAVLRAAGAVVAAIDAVFEGRAENAFAAVRPPGHHASATLPSGFCLFNNVVVGARHAQAKHGVRRVAIVDFDVHHGNGTQAIAETDPSLFYGSTHQYPFYPGTGSAREQGIDGNVVNVPLAAGSGGEEFRMAWADRILPALDRFAPELLIVSAGFDAHRRDPLAQLNLEVEDYAWLTRELLALSDRHCPGRLVSALEGGYDLQALAASTAAHVKVLMRANS
jgi:acetoin utilization deacetylase AcuC-like enzyme